MLTEEDIQKLSTILVTKSDLGDFVTKSDLEDLARKQDLKDFVTKSDLEVLRINTQSGFSEIKSDILATKSDLEALRINTQLGFSEIKSDILATKSDLEEVKSDIDSLRITTQLGFSDIKEDINSLRESIQISLVSSDKTAQAVADLQEEYHGITNELKNHDGTIRQLAKKADVALSY